LGLRLPVPRRTTRSARGPAGTVPCLPGEAPQRRRAGYQRPPPGTVGSVASWSLDPVVRSGRGPASERPR